MIEYPACPFCYKALIFDGDQIMTYCYECDSDLFTAIKIKDHEIDEAISIVRKK